MNELQLIADLVRDEGEKLRPYKDTVDKWTIGVGRNLTDRGISPQESRMLLQNDLSIVYRSLTTLLPWWKELDEVRQRALCNMCFNLGIAGLLRFKKMLKALETKNWDEAANQAKYEDPEAKKFSKWFTQVGPRAIRIVHMLQTGKDL